MAGMLAWYVHPQHVPWPGPGSVPILDLIALRNPGAYLLLRAWWFLAPLATGATLAAAAMSAWTVWGPGACRNAIARGTLPPDPFDPSSEEISLTIGELHHPTEPVESPSPSWLSIPARGLFTGVCIVGAVGSGKTSACMHPFARQLLGWRAVDPERRAAALVLDILCRIRHKMPYVGHIIMSGSMRKLLLKQPSFPKLPNIIFVHHIAFSCSSRPPFVFHRGSSPASSGEVDFIASSFALRSISA